MGMKSGELDRLLKGTVHQATKQGEHLVDAEISALRKTAEQKFHMDYDELTPEQRLKVWQMAPKVMKNK